MIDILSIDEAIAHAREVSNEQIANWLEELKVIKEMDLSIPQHFTKEQSDWIKKYCINRNKEFYNKAIDDVLKLQKYTFYDTSNEFMNIRIDAISIEDILKLKEQEK